MNELLAIRNRLGMTQAELAEKIGLSLRSYQEQETSDAPRLAYILAAQSFEPLSEAEKEQAEGLATRFLAFTALRLVNRIARETGKRIDLMAEAAQYRAHVPISAMPADHMRIFREAREIAARQIETASVVD